MPKRFLLLLLILLLAGCNVLYVDTEAPTPTPSNVVTLAKPTASTPTATPTQAPTATAAFLKLADARVSRKLLEQPELLIIPLAMIEKQVVNVPAESIPTQSNGEVFVYRPDIRVNGMDYGLHRSEGCNFNLADYVNQTRQIARERQIPMRILGPLILSESSYVNLVPDGSGGCHLMNNGVAACLTQIYKPSGWYFGASEQVHPGVNVWDLFDSWNCLSYGAQVLEGRAAYFEGLSGPREVPESWFNAVAGYKAITTSHSHFQNVFLKYYNAQGFMYTHPATGKSYWISFAEEDVDEMLTFE